jgi:hypothetical protein
MAFLDRTQMAQHPGEKLPNGATMLDCKWHKTSSSYMAGIVLAVAGGRDPFVTWERTVELCQTSSGGWQQWDYCYFGHYHTSLDDALNEYHRRVEEKLRERADAKIIRERGLSDGKAAATWIVDGNTPEPAKLLAHIMHGVEEGDPQVIDGLPQPRLGGEMAGEWTWEDICMDELDRYDDENEELYEVYMIAFNDGVLHEVARMFEEYNHD